MPTMPYMYANDLNEVLKKKHASGTYKSLVFYVEACESGSIFDGLLSEGLNIYATTASSPYEDSWGTYCPGDYPSPPPEYDTCLGDLYSISWMEDWYVLPNRIHGSFPLDVLFYFSLIYLFYFLVDSDIHNLKTETIRQQYNLVRVMMNLKIHVV